MKPKNKSHARANQEKYLRRRAEYEVYNDMFEDLPDGAYFAAMEEMGFDIEDHIEFSE